MKDMNLPNKLTLLRMFLTPFILVFIYFESFRIYALVLFVIAVASDYLDGWFAVKKNMRSRLGNFLDPLSDKILVLTCLTLLSFLELFPLWMVFIILAREFIMNGLRSCLSGKEKIVGANIGGKTKFALQSLVIFLSIIYLSYQTAYQQEFLLLLNVLLIIVVIITIVALLNFIFKNKEPIKELVKN